MRGEGEYKPEGGGRESLGRGIIGSCLLDLDRAHRIVIGSARQSARNQPAASSQPASQQPANVFFCSFSVIVFLGGSHGMALLTSFHVLLGTPGCRKSIPRDLRTQRPWFCFFPWDPMVSILPHGNPSCVSRCRCVLIFDSPILNL